MPIEYTKAYARTVEKAMLLIPGFLKHSINDSRTFQAGSNTLVAHEHAAIPTVSTKPGKLTAAEKKFNANSYAATEFATAPQKIKSFDEFFTSFSMRNSTAHVTALGLRNAFGTYALTEWAKKGKSNLILTSGDARAATYGTGTRKAVKYDDLTKILETFSKWEFPLEGRFCVVSERILADLKKMDEFKSMDYATDSSVATTLVGSILGFEVNVFNKLPAADLDKNSGATKIKGSTTFATEVTAADTNTAAAVFASKYAVRHGMSGVMTLSEVSTEERAHLMTSFFYGGANSVYANGDGIVLIAEGT